MSATVVGLFLFVTTLTVGCGRQMEVKYEILKDFKPSDFRTEKDTEKEWSERRPQRIQRAVPTGSANTSARTTKISTTAGFATNVTDNEDNHKYYKSRFDAAGVKQWWFNLEEEGTPKIHKKSQYSDTVKTSFQFPYYGHVIDKVTITNKGFLFVGSRVHKFNASAQYIAPLMADFAAELHEDTEIRYIDTGDRFTAEWKNIRLRNQPAGKFSFQCSIFNDGKLVFAYKNVPVPVSEIKNDSFFVRVGFSDSFDLHRIIPGDFIINGKHYKGIHFVIHYRYHHVELNSTNVRNGTAFVITPLPNCVLYKTCDSCIQSKTTFSCKWCPKLKRCSDGVDRFRHDWLVSGCYKDSVTKCQVRPPPTHNPTTGTIIQPHNAKKESDKSHGPRTAGVVILVIVCVAILLAIIGWVLYAFRNPSTSSGLFLIRYGNPRQWCRNTSAETTPEKGVSVSFKSMPNESNA